MTICDGCDQELTVEELTRHEAEGFVRVHCPSCGRLLGTYSYHNRGGGSAVHDHQ